MANKTLYIPITAPEEMIAESVELFAKSVGWTAENSMSAVDYSVSYIRKLVRNNIKQEKSRQVSAMAAQQAADAIDAILEGVEQEDVPPL